MRKYISFIMVLFCLTVAAEPNVAEAFGSIPPAVTQTQLNGSRPEGGSLLLDYNLNTNRGNKPMAWDDTYTLFSYDESGCYKFSRVSGNNSYFFSPTGRVFDVKPNRNYLVSALVYCDFDRVNSEVNVGMRIGGGTDGVTADDLAGEKPITLIDGFHGLPADTGGHWLRFETTVTTPPEAKKARFYGAWYGFKDPGEVFCIADMEVTELPALPLTPLGVGEGLLFGGSSGMYDMKTEAPEITDEAVIVRTNSAEYEFDKNNAEITVRQRIGNPRPLAVLKLDKSLASLKVWGTPSSNEVILTTGDGGLSFGVQMDGMLLISTHGSDAEITLTSKIGGKWNRLLSGNLISMDDTGGFTVNPAIVSGTGMLARCTAVSRVDFEVQRGNTDFISEAQPGWSVAWTISPGERLGVTAFPPREYDWDNSFDVCIANIDFSRGTDIWQNYKSNLDLRYGVLWSAFQGAWAMSYGTQYVPKDEAKLKAHISAAKNAGVEPIEYMSMFFWDGTLDEYINETARHRDKYGITGVYTDGVPPIDWLKAYEGMRRLREVFPNGCIVAHTTGQTENGGAPLATPELFIPAIDAYATFTLRGESVPGTAKDWAYPRFVTSGYGTSNVLGLQKYDGWTIDGKSISSEEQQLLQLLYNGRARYDGTYSLAYKTILAKAKEQWKASGRSGEYYESSYLPYVRRLVREEYSKLVESGKASAYPDVNILTETFDTESKWTQKENTAVLENGALKLGAGAVSTGDFLPCYGQTEISFKLKLSAGMQGKIDIKDVHGKTAISLLQTGDKLRYLNRRGGYEELCDIAEDSFVAVRISADPATGRYDLSINDSTVLEGESFSVRTAELSRIVIKNSALSAAMYIDDLTVNTGL